MRPRHLPRGAAAWRLRLALLGAAPSALMACAPSRAATFAPVDRTLASRLGVAPAWRADDADAQIAAMLAAPLDVTSAVKIALLNNRHLRAAFESLGIAAAEVASAGAIGATEVGLSYQRALAGDDGELELDVTQDVIAIVLAPRARGAARADLAAAQARAAAQAIAVARDAEVALLGAIAARQARELWATAVDTTAVAADLAARQRAAGNIDALTLAREQAQHEELSLALVEADLAVELAREDVNRALGLDDGQTAWTVAERLPELPAAPPDVAALEQDAVDASLELEALSAETRAADGRLRLARTRAWLPGLGVGVAATRRDGDGAWALGPALRLSLPIFDQGQGARAAAAAERGRAVEARAATSIDVRAHARGLRQRLRALHASARHLRDVVLPLQQRVLDETLLHYNAMNATPYELLAARRELIGAGQRYLAAQRAYWIADAEVRALRAGATADLAADREEHE